MDMVPLFVKRVGLPFLLLCVIALFFSISCQSDRNAGATERDSIPSKKRTGDEKNVATADKPADENPVMIQLVPLGKIEEGHIDLVVKAVETTFVARVLLSSKTAMPKKAYVPSRKRWMADDLLQFLNRMKKKNALKVIGLTDEDICTPTEKSPTWGIFGLGSLDGWSCVVSTRRLGSPSKHPKGAERLSKVVVHEIGHTFGLEHCPVRGCIMEDAQGTIVTVDREKAFCPACQKKLAPHLRENSDYSKWED